MLRTYLQYKPAWQQLLIFIAIALVCVVAASMCSIIPLKLYGISEAALEKGSYINLPNAKQFMIVAQVIQVIFLFVLSSYVFAYFASPTPSALLGTRFSTTPFYYGNTILLAFLGLLGMVVIGWLNGKLPLPKWALDMEKNMGSAVEILTTGKTMTDLIVNVIVIALLAAIGEELFFRSVLQRICIQWTKDPWWGIIITSAVFAAFHFQFAGFLPRMFLGIILGALYWYSGSIYTSILFHFLINGIQVVIKWQSQFSTSLKKLEDINAITTPALVLSTVAIGVVILLIVQLRKRTTITYAAVYPKEPSFFDV